MNSDVSHASNELTERGIGALWGAMGRRGGVDAWREVVAAHLAAGPAAASRRAEPIADAFGAVRGTNRIAAYFMFQNGHPGDPESHWQAAERQLAAA